MKRIVLVAGLCTFGWFPTTGRAQVIVNDPAAIAQSAMEHAIDVAKYVEMIAHQVEQINLLTSQLQQLTAYVQAFGNPAMLLQITGADQIIRQLQQGPTGQLLGDLQQTASGLESLRYNAEGLYRSIETISVSGIEVPRSEELYKKFGALENTAQNFLTVHEETTSRVQSLKHDISATTTALQAATTDSQVQKLRGVLTSQQAELSALQAEVQQAASQVLVQDAMNRNDEEKQRRAQQEKDAAEFGIMNRQFDELLTLPESMQR